MQIFSKSLKSHMSFVLAFQWVLENLPIPHDDIFLNDLHREWKLRGKKLDFNDGVARIALGYGAQVRRNMRLY